MMNVWGLTDIGLVRKENQDAYAVRLNDKSGHTVCVVCDGMGGAKGGQLASKLASLTFLHSCLSNLSAGMTAGEVAKVTEFAVSAANSRIYEYACENPELKGMGTTLVSAVSWDDQLLINNVGDSRAYLVRAKAGGDGRHISRITKDHSLVEKLVDLGNITEEEARRHPDRNLITRALGPEESADSDSYLVTLEEGDAVLLCTDGLIDTVRDKEMEREILDQRDLNGCLGRLLQIAKNRGASDNVTAVLLRKL